MNKLANKLTHIGDIIAIPFFLLLTIYFYKIENKSNLENILFLFSFACLIIDTTFTYFFLTGFKKKQKIKKQTKTK
jgi:hypothetical protein